MTSMMVMPKKIRSREIAMVDWLKLSMADPAISQRAEILATSILYLAFGMARLALSLYKGLHSVLWPHRLLFMLYLLLISFVRQLMVDNYHI